MNICRKRRKKLDKVKKTSRESPTINGLGTDGSVKHKLTHQLQLYHILKAQQSERMSDALHLYLSWFGTSKCT